MGAAPPPGVYLTDGAKNAAAAKKKGAAKGKAAKKKATSPGGKGAAAPPSDPGEPNVAAKHFTVGTRRPGVDGRMYEVDLVHGGIQVWVAEKAASAGAARKRSRTSE